MKTVIIYQAKAAHNAELIVLILIIALVIISLILIPAIGFFRQRKIQKERIIEENYKLGKEIPKKELQEAISAIEETIKKQSDSAMREAFENVNQGLKKALREKNDDQ